MCLNLAWSITTCSKNNASQTVKGTWGSCRTRRTTQSICSSSRCDTMNRRTTRGLAGTLIKFSRVISSCPWMNLNVGCKMMSQRGSSTSGACKSDTVCLSKTSTCSYKSSCHKKVRTKLRRRGRQFWGRSKRCGWKRVVNRKKGIEMLRVWKRANRMRKSTTPMTMAGTAAARECLINLKRRNQRAWKPVSDILIVLFQFRSNFSVFN